MCHDFHVLGRVATMDTATQHSKLSYQNYLEYTKCVLRGNVEMNCKICGVSSLLNQNRMV